MDHEPDLATPEHLMPVLEALIAREPLFHHRHLVADRADFDREAAPEFWEVGASGRRYSREFVWSAVAERLATLDADPYVSEGWQVIESCVAELAPDTYLVHYALLGQGRRTRRTTLWQGSVDSGWTARFHQGTVAPD